MRLFTIIVSTLFVIIGVSAIRDGDSDGWLIAGFFGFCLLIAVFDPWLPKPWLRPDFRLVITSDEIACEHRKRPRESIRWENINQIWYITTADGPRFPDEWILFEGMDGGCSFPTEADGMNKIWDEFEQRFPGFDYGPLIRGGTDEAKHLCWERRR